MLEKSGQPFTTSRWSGTHPCGRLFRAAQFSPRHWKCLGSQGAADSVSISKKLQAPKHPPGEGGEHLKSQRCTHLHRFIPKAKVSRTSRACWSTKQEETFPRRGQKWKKFRVLHPEGSLSPQ